MTPEEETKYIYCSGCNMKYLNNEENIKSDFGYNRLEERYKTCFKCRAKKKIFHENNKEKIKLEDKTHYEKHKDKLLEYQNIYRDDNKDKFKEYHTKNNM